MTTQIGEVPVVDLGALAGTQRQQATAIEELGSVCHEIGFFVVVNHGVATDLTSTVFDFMRQWFAIPAKHKELVARHHSRHFRGWDPVGAESTNNRTDIREQFDVWSEWPAHSSTAMPPQLRLLGPNQWLADELLPGHRAVFQHWIEECRQLARRILGALGLSIGLANDHFDTVFGHQPMSLAKFIHYPPTPPSGAGVNAHHDAGFLTVLAAGSTPGLQIETAEGSWIDVPVVEDSFVINLGEMLQAMTGQYLIATPHRVITAEERFSAGYFHGPSLDTALTPLVLDEQFSKAVAASPRHQRAGFMAPGTETSAGVGDMLSDHVPTTYGAQLWNYFERSYPEIVAEHHRDLIPRI